MLVAFSSVSFCQEIKNNYPMTQSESKKYTYCELVERIKAFSKNTIEIDFGKSAILYKTNPEYLYENGKQIVFDSFIDGMNYMGNLGWEFVQVYTKDFDGKNYSEQDIKMHWILRKEIKE